jgi:hypothetical protein
MDIDEAKAFFEEKESSLINQVCGLLRGHEEVIVNYMADLVAATCGVDKEMMLNDCDKLYMAQARWLYWYAIRYMTNDTYEKIAERTALQGHNYASSSIGLCINKMSQLIETNPLWQHRWGIVKSIAKVWMDGGRSNQRRREIKITVHHSNEYDVKFDIKKD